GIDVERHDHEGRVITLEYPDFYLVDVYVPNARRDLELPGYYQFWNSAEKKGYSGTAIFTKHEPLSVNYGIDVERHDHEGRVITLEYPDFYLVDVYVPNARRDLERLEYRMDWEDCFREYVRSLDKHKPVIICGDMNVAHEEIDLKNYKTNRGNAGFTDEERGKMTELLGAGFADTFRYLYPEKGDSYSWWSYMFHAREKNAGWRIDYFICSQRFAEKIEDSLIYPQYYGSDHCPVAIITK
ncbi:MAG: exodeoxyribonuclease III, partial [Oscillospiraceae bacterium]|nr:exodeoxyribonuclease III [Oscillospiraceae bacterium]